MKRTIENWGGWLLKCAIIGLIPGAICWAVWLYLDGNATFGV